MDHAAAKINPRREGSSLPEVGKAGEDKLGQQKEKRRHYSFKKKLMNLMNKNGTN